MTGDVLPVPWPPQLFLIALMVVTSTTGFAISTVVLLQMVGIMQPDSLNCLHFSRGLLPRFTTPLQMKPKTRMLTLRQVCVIVSSPLFIGSVTTRNFIPKNCALQRIPLSLDRMVQFAQRFRALDALPQPQTTCSTTATQPLPQTPPVDLQRLDRLEKLVYEMAATRPPVVAAVGRHSPAAQSTSRFRCFLCKEIGHVVRSCPLRSREKQCTVCGGWGHKPEVCGSNRRFSPEEHNDDHSQFVDSRKMTNSKCESFPLNFQGVPRY